MENKLSKQFYLYSVDTKAFYSEEEANLNMSKFEHINKIKLIKEWATLKYYGSDLCLGEYIFRLEQIKILKSEKPKGYLDSIRELSEGMKLKRKSNNNKNIYTTTQEKVLNKTINEDHDKREENKLIKDILMSEEEYVNAHRCLKEINERLVFEIKNNKSIRRINQKALDLSVNKIRLFDNSFSRATGVEEETLTDDIIVVRVYHYEVVNQLINNGFEYVDLKTGEIIKYRAFTASAGQIRTKKVIFVKEETWNKVEKTIMCGLTIDSINEKGGCNVTKFLAYLALCNSATDEILDFDIDRSIVIEDFENVVVGEVDYIDNKTFEITRKVMGVPINQSDGCGWISPRVNMKNFMIRLPWIKGLMTPVNYIKFANENNCSTIVKDIYGKEHDLKNVDYVFTKSQFKMWKYYDSWEEYQEYFKKYNCSANMCNLEPNASEFKNASLNYQMWQTLTDITDEEIKSFTSNVEELVSNGYSKRKTMIELLGADSSNKNKTSLQKCIEIYPELINLKYVKEKLASMLNARKKEAKYGKFKMDGKYTFVVPDVVAWLEHVFGLEVKGHLLGNEVSCKLYKKAKELIANRSPHLYREWGVRSNKEPSKWYLTNAIYASVFDLISKMLAFDVDGDKLLVIDNPKLVEIAKRNMEGIVPLYYEMGKANAQIINTQSIYNSLIQAFKFNNIGKFSNKLTVMWNNDEIDIPTIAQLTALNNFTIDAAKTLLVPEVPKNVMDRMKASNGKMPYFFQFAKDKHVDDVCISNGSTVNRICKNIENIQSQTFNNKCLGKLDYNLLISNEVEDINEKACSLFRNMISERNMYFKLLREYGFDSDRARKYFINEMKDRFTSHCKLTDVDLNSTIDSIIIKFIKSTNGNVLDFMFDMFGEYIYQNLINNISNPLGEHIMCDICGKRVKLESKNSRRKYCEKCSVDENINKTIKNRGKNKNR